MPQFVTNPRSQVRDRLESQDFVAETQPCGPGLTVVLSPDRKDITGFTALAEEDGWYIDQIDHGHSQLVVVIMPYPSGGD